MSQLDDVTTVQAAAFWLRMAARLTDNATQQEVFVSLSRALGEVSARMLARAA